MTRLVEKKKNKYITHRRISYDLKHKHILFSYN